MNSAGGLWRRSRERTHSPQPRCVIVDTTQPFSLCGMIDGNGLETQHAGPDPLREFEAIVETVSLEQRQFSAASYLMLALRAGSRQRLR